MDQWHGFPCPPAKGRGMTRTVIWAGLGAVCLTFVASEVMAGPIAGACLQSKRQAANAALCTCIQKVADVTLRAADQRRAATFFRDPDKAQQALVSKKRADDEFWARYKVFGAQAEQSCSG